MINLVNLRSLKGGKNEHIVYITLHLYENFTKSNMCFKRIYKTKKLKPKALSIITLYNRGPGIFCLFVF